nr:GNAT family N-acetyltransferase [Agreia sp. COWG]
MSSSGVFPDGEGRFRRQRLDAALTEPGWGCYVLRLGASPVGICLIRGFDDEERIISSFFVVRGARRAGHGRAAVRHLTRQHRGRWAVAFQDANKPAAEFWRAVAADADPTWTHEHREVPGRLDLPHDSWVRFTVQ